MRKCAHRSSFSRLPVGRHAGPAGAQSAAEVNSNLDSLFGDHKPDEQFLTKLKEAVAEDDKETVASTIRITAIND